MTEIVAKAVPIREESSEAFVHQMETIGTLYESTSNILFSGELASDPYVSNAQQMMAQRLVAELVHVAIYRESVREREAHVKDHHGSVEPHVGAVIKRAADEHASRVTSALSLDTSSKPALSALQETLRVRFDKEQTINAAELRKSDVDAIQQVAMPIAARSLLEAFRLRLYEGASAAPGKGFTDAIGKPLEAVLETLRKDSARFADTDARAQALADLTNAVKEIALNGDAAALSRTVREYDRQAQEQVKQLYAEYQHNGVIDWFAPRGADGERHVNWIRVGGATGFATLVVILSSCVQMAELPPGVDDLIAGDDDDNDDDLSPEAPKTPTPRAELVAWTDEQALKSLSGLVDWQTIPIQATGGELYIRLNTEVLSHSDGSAMVFVPEEDSDTYYAFGSTIFANPRLGEAFAPTIFFGGDTEAQVGMLGNPVVVDEGTTEWSVFRVVNQQVEVHPDFTVQFAQAGDGFSVTLKMRTGELVPLTTDITAPEESATLDTNAHSLVFKPDLSLVFHSVTDASDDNGANPTETPQPTVATEIPPFSDVIPDTYEEFLAKVASGEIPTFDTQEAFDAHKAELAQTWLLTGEGNDIRPAEVFNKFDNKLGQSVLINFVNRGNFMVRDIVVGPSGAEFVLAEIMTPAGNRQIIDIHATDPDNNDKNLIFSKVLKDMENGELVGLFVRIKFNTPNIVDPLVIPMLENAPDEVNNDLWQLKFPENIADKELVITNVSSIAYPEDIAQIFDN